MPLPILAVVPAIVKLGATLITGGSIVAHGAGGVIAYSGTGYVAGTYVSAQAIAATGAAVVGSAAAAVGSAIYATGSPGNPHD